MLSLTSKQQIAREVGFFLVLLEIELVGFAEHFPIDVAHVVAGHVFAVLGELDAEAVVRAAMHAGNVPFDNMPGTQLQTVELSQRLRIEILLEVFHAGFYEYLPRRRRDVGEGK